MNSPLINIDSSFEALDDNDVTAEVIDTYISTMSLGALDVERRLEHLLELVTDNDKFWERLSVSSDINFWIKEKHVGIAVFLPNKDCGFTRSYRQRSKGIYQPQLASKQGDKKWKVVQSEKEFLTSINTIESSTVFSHWKKHKLEVNALSTKFAQGRLDNTAVDRVWIVSKGDGCAICGAKATHQARTTLSEIGTLLLTINLCEKDSIEAQKHPCVLVFFGTLFTLQLDVGDLIKLDYIPEELIGPICELISSHINAEFSKPTKRDNGWHIRFEMKDKWVWVLRLNKLTDYAYILLAPDGKEMHKIDSADHHKEVPFGPDHQHFYSKRKKKRIEPSFSYGIPMLDFPLLIKSREFYGA